MSSLNQHINDIKNADDVANSPAARHALSTTKEAEFREFLLSDSYAFTFIVCRHRDMVPEVHMPISYAACGLADKLSWVIDQSGFESYVIDQFRANLRLREILPSEVHKIDPLLNFVNFRISRATFKSSVITHGGATFVGTKDPNTTAKLTHAVDDKAWDFCSQIAETVRSGIYRDLFPDRIPVGNVNELVTMKSVTLGGRTISHPQTTIQASGYQSKDTSAHYDTFWTDDLVVEGNASPALLPGVHRWLRNMPGFFMPTRRVRRIFAGTRWDEDDDHNFLTTGNRALACLSIVIPIEVHDKPAKSILERGRPSMPSFINVAKVQEIQDAVLSDEKEIDGARSWRCNFLLDPASDAARLFPPAIVDDVNRQWQELPYPRVERGKQYAGRFLVARPARDKQGEILKDRDGNNKILRFDPWRELDRVLTLDAAWSEGGDNWAVSASGFDYDGVHIHLDTRSDDDGMEGWLDALPELDAIYLPRVIGYDAHGMQDEFIQNLMRTDKRLKRLAHKMKPIRHQKASKPSVIKAGLAEPLAMYRFLWAPGLRSAQARAEAKAYRGNDKNAIDGIVDTLAMAPAVSMRRLDPETKQRRIEAQKRAEQARRQGYDPVLGVSAA